jgi:hypothetical protein
VMPAIGFVVLILLIFGIIILGSVTLGYPALTTSELLDLMNIGMVIVIVFGLSAFIAAALHVAFLGLPAFIIGEQIGRVRWWSSTIAGFFLGSLPTALLTLPRQGSSSSVSGIPLEGVSTLASWLDFGGKSLIMGFFGAVGGFAFWRALQSQNRQISNRDDESD